MDYRQTKYIVKYCQELFYGLWTDEIYSQVLPGTILWIIDRQNI